MTATVCIVDGDKVLLHKHKKYGTRFAVGGHLEKDEKRIKLWLLGRFA